MPAESLPDRPVATVAESQATERPSLAYSLTDCELVKMAQEIEQQGYLAPSDASVWSDVTRFHDFAEVHIDEVQQSVRRWLQSEKEGKGEKTRTAVLRGEHDAVIATLVCVTDWILDARENDGVGVGSKYMPLIPRLGLDTFAEISLAIASVTVLKDRPPAPAVPPPEATRDTPRECGRLHITVPGKELTYPVTERGVTERRFFHIQGEKMWDDIYKLMRAEGQFVKMDGTFRNRWGKKGDASDLRKIAFESEMKRGQRGNGRYRLLK